MRPDPGECHLWLVPVRPRPDWLPLLDVEERERAARLGATPAGDTFVTSRATQRLVGSVYLGVEPSAVVTERVCTHCATGAAHGRPRYRGAAVDYSVSHTEDWLLLAVTGSGLVGADIEHLDAMADPAALARAALTERERARFALLPEADRAGWLLGAWTRKEAAMKVTGLGLQAPPSLVDVSGPVAAVAGVPAWPDGDVHLHRVGAPAGHAAALATTFPLRALRHYRLAEDAVRTPEPVGAPM